MTAIRLYHNRTIGDFPEPQRASAPGGRQDARPGIEPEQATGAPSARAAKTLYRRRPWPDETFGDCKGHGFDLEATRLRSFRALSRLILAVVLRYAWTVAFGSQTIKNGRRRPVDRSDRRDRSIFRIGLDMLERCLTNNERISWGMMPYFT